MEYDKCEKTNIGFLRARSRHGSVWFIKDLRKSRDALHACMGLPPSSQKEKPQFIGDIERERVRDMSRHIIIISSFAKVSQDSTPLQNVHI